MASEIDAGKPEEAQSTEATMAWVIDALKAIDPVFDGRISVVSHIAEQTSLDEGSVLRVFQDLGAINLPDAIYDYLSRHGATQEDVGTIHIGIKRVSEAIVLQHIGLLEAEIAQLDQKHES